jgi:hypothetical protein
VNVVDVPVPPEATFKVPPKVIFPVPEAGLSPVAPALNEVTPVLILNALYAIVSTVSPELAPIAKTTDVPLVAVKSDPASFTPFLNTSIRPTV